MTFEERLMKKQYGILWQEYCGFLDFSISEYMAVQNRLLMEQIEMYNDCELGKRFFRNRKPNSVEEFRKLVPLTSYNDYADILLNKNESALPSKPVIWIETTWEGGKNPVKVAPYTESMVKANKNIFLTCMILATSNKKGEFSLDRNDKFLYGMAPLPYLTGLAPYSIQGELSIDFLPPLQEAEKMSFGQRNTVGFKLGLKKGIDLFFGVSSVILRMSEMFSSGSKDDKEFKLSNNTLHMNYRLLKAWNNNRVTKTPILPKDIWKLKGLICAGTDTLHYKDKIEEYWGIRPLEIFGGTETACIASETWEKDGLVLFPDLCFYEFIPEIEMERNIENPSYIPKTYLMNELIPGTNYELVITNLKGGAFVRYRLGDMFKCLTTGKEDGEVKLPKFSYLDRIPTTIDISSFTRISESTIKEVISLSKIDINDWFAIKEFDENDKSFMHLYMELGAEGIKGASAKDLIKEHLSLYFRYVDNDYRDLKKLLGMDPLQVSIIPTGTIQYFKFMNHKQLRRMNPLPYDVLEILKIAGSRNEVE